MIYEFNTEFDLDQNLNDDQLIDISKLKLSTNYCIIDYVLTLAKKIISDNRLSVSKDSIILYFINGSFDTNINEIPNKKSGVISYTTINGSIKQVDITNSIQLELKNGCKFIFYLKDAFNNIVSEKNSNLISSNITSITFGSEAGQSDLSQARDALLIPDKLSVVSGNYSHLLLDVIKDNFGNKIQTISLFKGFKYKVRISGTVYTNNKITETLKIGIININNKMEDYTLEIIISDNYKDYVKIEGEISIDLTNISEKIRIYRKCIITYKSQNAIAKLEDSLGFTFFEE